MVPCLHKAATWHCGMKSAAKAARQPKTPLPESLAKKDICYADSCPMSKGYFRRALLEDALVCAKLPMPGFELRIFVKGLAEGKEQGNVLGYEPDTNTVWSICVRNGKFVGAKKTHKFANADLQELFWEKKPL